MLSFSKAINTIAQPKSSPYLEQSHRCPLTPNDVDISVINISSLRRGRLKWCQQGDNDKGNYINETRPLHTAPPCSFMSLLTVFAA